MKEKWVSVPDYKNVYEVSDAGNVRRVGGGKLKPHVNFRNGYVYVCLSKHNQKKTYRLHRIVAKAFLGDREDMQVNHIDGNKTNNSLSNLEWVTQSENMKHAYRTGLEKIVTKRVINLDTNEIYNSVTEAAQQFGNRKPSAITKVCKGERSHYRGVRFAYLDDFENDCIPPFRGKFRKRSSRSLWVA